MTLPESSLISAVRLSHSTWSKGEPAWVWKRCSNLRPFDLGSVMRGRPAAGLVPRAGAGRAEAGLLVLERKDEFVAIIESCLVGGRFGAIQSILGGRSLVDPTPLYVGELSYKATIAGGRKEFFSGRGDKFLFIVPQQFMRVHAGLKVAFWRLICGPGSREAFIYRTSRRPRPARREFEPIRAWLDSDRTVVCPPAGQNRVRRPPRSARWRRSDSA